jgi:carbamate kinase
VILTGVDQVSIDFGTPEERPVARLSLAEARAHLAAGQFPEGSMGPKVRSAVEFAEAARHEVLITSAGRLAQAVRGRAGTRIVPDEVTVAATPARRARPKAPPGRRGAARTRRASRGGDA